MGREPMGLKRGRTWTIEQRWAKMHPESKAIANNEDIAPCLVEREIIRAGARRRNQRRIDAGLTSAQVWVPPEDLERLRRYTKRLRKERNRPLPQD